MTDRIKETGVPEGNIEYVDATRDSKSPPFSSLYS